MALIVGIDGCASGWLCLLKDLETDHVCARIISNIAELLTLDPRPQIAMVDVPIGLTDAGQRDCDRIARAILKSPRASSVFPAPIRPMLAAATYEEACAIGERVHKRKLSRQSWAILPKIREVDSFLRSNPTNQQWIREVHPEICFWAWNGNKPMTNSKKRKSGREEREVLVKPVFGTAYSSAQSSLPRGQYKVDDLLDAFAALWSAERAINGQESVFPARQTVDSSGLRMEIVA